jgi:hypothetical protein
VDKDKLYDKQYIRWLRDKEKEYPSLYKLSHAAFVEHLKMIVLDGAEVRKITAIKFPDDHLLKPEEGEVFEFEPDSSFINHIRNGNIIAKYNNNCLESVWFSTSNDRVRL